MIENTIYLDNAATTACDERVLKQMLPYFCADFGNPSSLHSIGRKANAAYLRACEQVAQCLNCEPKEIVFTSGGTESDNAVIAAFATENSSIVISAIEHPAIIKACERAKKKGCEIIRVMPNSDGVITPEAVEHAIKQNTALVSVMAVNNETGVIQPIKEIAKVAHKHGKHFHSDAVQAAGVLPLDVKDLGADMLTLSAHKIYGPKGVGALYVKNGIRFLPFTVGGSQQREFRAGTINIAGAVGFAAALALANADMQCNREKICKLRDAFVARIIDGIEGAKLNAKVTDCSPQIVNVSFSGVDNASALIKLDEAGIACSAGAACSAGSLTPSHVLTAMGLDEMSVRGSLRFSFSKYNKLEQINLACDKIKTVIDKLREGKTLFLQTESATTRL